MYLYMLGYITPNVSEFNTHTFIGCTSDFEARFHEHNSNGGGWIPIMLLEFPSTFSVDAVQIICDNWKKKHNITSRIRHGFQTVRDCNLRAYVSDLKVGLLKEMPPGDTKVLSQQFWETL